MDSIKMFRAGEEFAMPPSYVFLEDKRRAMAKSVRALLKSGEITPVICDSYVAFEDDECYVCALGACLYTLLGKTISNVNKRDAYSILSNTFSMSQLKSMEDAFEGWTCQYYEMSAVDRLDAIMANVEKNGEFVA